MFRKYGERGGAIDTDQMKGLFLFLQAMCGDDWICVISSVMGFEKRSSARTRLEVSS